MKTSRPLTQVLLLSCAWTGVLVSLLMLNLSTIENGFKRVARETSSNSFKLIVLTRAWNALHGGVYLFTNSKVEPNPYLEVKDRDIVLEDGRKLTMINPAYMTRLVAELAKNRENVTFHITSLNPVRPENAPDPWEKHALESFEKGTREKFEIAEASTGSHFRYMAPLTVTPACMKCHAKQGYRMGDIRGGISVTSPAAPMLTIAHADMRSTAATYGVIWLLGIAGLFVYGRSTRRYEQRLHNQLLFQVALLECMAVPVFYKDAQGVYLGCNKSFEDLIGRDRTEIIGKTVYDVAEADDARSYHEHDMQLMAKGGNQTYEFVVQTGHQGRRNVIFSKAVFLDSHGRTAGIIGAITDITERRALEKALLLSRKLESVGKLAAGLAQEISAPLQHLENNIEFIRAVCSKANASCAIAPPGDRDERAAQVESLCTLMADLPGAATDAKSSSNRIGKIVGAMRQFFSEAPTDTMPIHINTVLKNAVTLFEGRMRKSSQVETAFGQNLPVIEGNPQELMQALLNILLNAVQANEDAMALSGDMGTLRIATHADADAVEVRIADTGPGIAEEDRERVFDPLFTTRGVGQGTGLGLSTAWFIVHHRLGGTIDFKTTPGQGSSFTIRIPLTPPTGLDNAITS